MADRSGAVSTALGADRTVELRIEHGQGPALTLGFSPEEALHAGFSLLVGGSMLSARNAPTQPGLKISDIPAEGVHLPVTHWRTGYSNISKEPVLIFTIPGGAQLAFAIPAASARDCGQALAEEGLKAVPTAGSMPS